MSGRLILTIGTGKTGTHTLHNAMKAAGVRSLHEPEPLLAAESVLYYQGFIYGDQALRLHEFGRLCGMLRNELKEHPLVHVVCHRATPLALHLVREFGAELIWLRRQDFMACVASWVVHGAHNHYPLFIQPRTDAAHQWFMSASQVGRVAWYVRQMNRVAEQIVYRVPTRGLTVDTESFEHGAPNDIAKFLPVELDVAELRQALRLRQNVTASDKTKAALSLMVNNLHEIQEVQSGELDEEVPEL